MGYRTGLWGSLFNLASCYFIARGFVCVIVFKILKLIIDPALFHNCIGNVSRFYFAIYREILVFNRAVPNIVVAFTPTYKGASILL